IGTDEAASWRAVLDRLPTDITELPQEWSDNPWVLVDNDHNYWDLYQSMIEHRAHLVELMAQQREYVGDSELLGGIYDVHGSKRFNAFTSNDQTTYMVGLTANCLELWMYMESDRFQNPVFRAFYSERNVVIEEARNYENEPGSLVYQALARTAFQAHPYGRPVIGWRTDIRRTLRSDMEHHFQQYYAPNNCQITMVGDVDTDEVFSLIERYFGSWEASEVAEERLVREPEQNGERRVMVEFDAESQLRIGFHAPVSPHPDAYALTMLDYILSAGRTSPFYRSIFEEQQLTASSPWCGAASGRYDELFTIGATPKAPHTTEEVETAIYAELDLLKSELVSERELERIRNQFRVHQLGRLRSNLWLAFTLSSAFVDRGGDLGTITEDFNRLMEVTPEDIQRVTKKYFTVRNRTVAILVKPTGSEVTDQTTETPQAGGQ
ncbi:MAG: pitrilysin family protein, partial [Candidatus Electryoneaceae bacterium]|nr:pitrilysin family protein [Candidatus Electryoneaceae bacterium]